MAPSTPTVTLHLTGDEARVIDRALAYFTQEHVDETPPAIAAYAKVADALDAAGEDRFRVRGPYTGSRGWTA
jgi:hypothetical protein